MFKIDKFKMKLVCYQLSTLSFFFLGTFYLSYPQVEKCHTIKPIESLMFIIMWVIFCLTQEHIYENTNLKMI